jgi:hypothetical protein
MPSNLARFSKGPYTEDINDTYPEAHKRVLENERKLIEQLDEKKRNYFQAYRLAIIKNF